MTTALPTSEVLWTSENGILRAKSQITGIPKLQGVFRMRDQEGFPVDVSYEIAKERGWEIDWIEALADAGRQCIFKFQSLLEEIAMLEGDAEQAERVFGMILMAQEGETFCEKAATLYRRQRPDLN